MINTLFLPELREMLQEDRTDDLREFCIALHPARTAEFMEGLDNNESWRVLQHAQPSLQAEIFQYFDSYRQAELLATQDEKQVAVLVTQLPADDAVDLLRELPASMRFWPWCRLPTVVISADCKRSPREPPARS